MTFPSITIQGNIFSTEILDKISKEEVEYQRSLDFGFHKEIKVRDEIGLAYAMSRGYWNSFRLKLERLTETEAATTETRNLWMIPFLTELGYTVEKANQEVINGKSYASSHRAQNLGRFPINIVGFRQDLDRKDDFTQTRISSHGLVQEYLNVTDDHIYALITNWRSWPMWNSTWRKSSRKTSSPILPSSIACSMLLECPNRQEKGKNPS